MFNWYKYFELAEELVLREDQSCYRTAISRGYYALFNILCSYTNGLGRSDKHATLIRIFKDEYEWHKFTDDLAGIEDSDLKFIGNELDFLRTKRNQADYDKRSITKQEAKEVCEKVQIIFDIIDESQ